MGFRVLQIHKEEPRLGEDLGHVEAEQGFKS